MFQPLYLSSRFSHSQKCLRDTQKIIISPWVARPSLGHAALARKMALFDRYALPIDALLRAGTILIVAGRTVLNHKNKKHDTADNRNQRN